MSEIAIKIEEKLRKKKEIIINKDIFYESSILIPLITIDNITNLILQVRADNIRQGGEISFPGGRIDEKDKSYFETAIRETCEEFGINKREIEILGYLGSYLNPMGNLVHGIVGEIKLSNLKEINPNVDEVKEVFTVPLDFFINKNPETYYMKIAVEPFVNSSGKKKLIFPAKKLGLDEKYSEKRDGVTYPVYVYNYADKIIWGLTAYFIKYFVETIKEKR